MVLPSSAVSQSEDCKSRLTFHFKPLMIVSRVFGYEINPVVKLSSKQKRLKAIIELTFFFVHVFINVTYTALSIQPYVIPTKADNVQRTPVYVSVLSGSILWNYVIDLCNFNTLSIGTHAAILYLLRQNEWKELWQNLEQQKSSVHCRKIVFLGIVLFLVVCPNSFCSSFSTV